MSKQSELILTISKQTFDMCVCVCVCSKVSIV